MLHLSNLTGKLERIRAISTNTLTNHYCNVMHTVKDDSIICTKCYSWAMLQGFRKNVAIATQRNSDILSKTLIPYDDVEVIKDDIFRFNAHGELINTMHFKNLVNIARKNPDCTFALWTKRKNLVARYFKHWRNAINKPSNLILIYSNPRIDKLMTRPPKWFDKTFNNVSPQNFVRLQNCTGQKCNNCRICYTHNPLNRIVEGVKNRG